MRNYVNVRFFVKEVGTTEGVLITDSGRFGIDEFDPLELYRRVYLSRRGYYAETRDVFESTMEVVKDAMVDIIIVFDAANAEEITFIKETIIAV